MKLALAFFLMSCADGQGPHLIAASPSQARAGATVMLEGERMCGEGDCARAAGEIQIGLSGQVVIATIVDYRETSATIVIPTVTPAGETFLVATVNERVSNELAFEVLP